MHGAGLGLAYKDLSQETNCRHYLWKNCYHATPSGKCSKYFLSTPVANTSTAFLKVTCINWNTILLPDTGKLIRWCFCGVTFQQMYRLFGCLYISLPSQQQFDLVHSSVQHQGELMSNLLSSQLKVAVVQSSPPSSPPVLPYKRSFSPSLLT